MKNYKRSLKGDGETFLGGERVYLLQLVNQSQSLPRWFSMEKGSMNFPDQTTQKAPQRLAGAEGDVLFFELITRKLLYSASLAESSL